jgi:hypothetical protein
MSFKRTHLIVSSFFSTKETTTIRMLPAKLAFNPTKLEPNYSSSFFFGCHIEARNHQPGQAFYQKKGKWKPRAPKINPEGQKKLWDQKTKAPPLATRRHNCQPGLASSRLSPHQLC